jgi:hypothetical protein
MLGGVGAAVSNGRGYPIYVAYYPSAIVIAHSPFFEK